MADNVAKIKLPDDSDQAAANDDMEYGDQGQKPIGGDTTVKNGELRINKVQGDAKKIGDDKIELINNLKIEDNDPEKAAIFNAAIAGSAGLAAQVANDNVETPVPDETQQPSEQTEETSTPDESVTEQPTTEENAPPTPTSEPQETTPPPKPQTENNVPKTPNQTQPEELAQEAPKPEGSPTTENGSDKMNQDQPNQSDAEKETSTTKAPPTVSPTPTESTTTPRQQTTKQPKKGNGKKPPTLDKNGIRRTNKDGVQTASMNKKTEQRPSKTLGDIGPHGSTKTPPLTNNPTQAQTDMNARQAQKNNTTVPPTASASVTPNTLPANQQNDAASQMDAAIQQQKIFDESKKIQQKQHNQLSKKRKRKEAKKRKDLLKQIDKDTEHLISGIEQMQLALWFPTVLAMILLAKIEIRESVKKTQKAKGSRIPELMLASKAYALAANLEAAASASFLVDTWAIFSKFWLSWSVDLYWWTVIMVIFDLIVIFPFFMIIFYVFKGRRIRIMMKVETRAKKIADMAHEINLISDRSKKNTVTLTSGRQ